MNDAFEALAIGLAVTMIFSVPFAFFAFIRYLRYKETIALAKRGLLRDQEQDRRTGRSTMRWGIVLTFMGLALFLGLLPLGILMDADSFLGPWLLLGCLPMFFGFSLLTIYFVTKREDSGSDGVNGQAAEDPIPPHKQ